MRAVSALMVEQSMMMRVGLDQTGSSSSMTASASASADTQADNDIAQGRQIGELADGLAAGFLGERGGFFSPCGSIPALSKPCLWKVARHAQAHRAQADKSSSQSHWHSTSMEALAERARGIELGVALR